MKTGKKGKERKKAEEDRKKEALHKEANARAIRDFEIYAKGVERLKELREEIDCLDTSHFRKEEHEIRQKLKNVHMIPQIERELRELKAKVSGIDIDDLKERTDERQSERIRHLEKKMRDVKELRELRKKLGIMRKELEKAKIKKEIHKEIIMRQAIKEVEDRIRMHVGKEIEKLDKEEGRLGKIEDRAGRIPFLQRRISALSHLLGVKSEELTKEEKEIAVLKNRLYGLKRELESKAEELEKELNQKTKIPAKKRILDKVRELSEKIDENKEELYKKVIEGISESRWDIEREKRELRDELSDVVAESRWLIEKQAEEINEQLLGKIEELNKKFGQEKKELHDRLSERIIHLRAQVNALQKAKLESREILFRDVLEKEKSGKTEKPEKIEEVGLIKNLKNMEKIKAMEIPFHFKPLFTKQQGSMIQPFAPAPEIKIRELKQKTEPKLIMKMYGMPEPEIVEASELLNISKLPELPELPELTEYPKLPKSLELPEHPELPEVSAEHKHKLPVISKQEFMRDVREAEKKLKPVKQARKKGPVFLEAQNFQNIGKEIGFFKSELNSFEQGIKDSLSEKSKEYHEIAELIDETEKVQGLLSKKLPEIGRMQTRKKPLFLEIEKFQDTEGWLGSIKSKINKFESDLSKAAGAGYRNSEQTEISSLIGETEKIQDALSSINKKILSKVKEV